jgi:hypothetical protein
MAVCLHFFVCPGVASAGKIISWDDTDADSQRLNAVPPQEHYGIRPLFLRLTDEAQSWCKIE